MAGININYTDDKNFSCIISVKPRMNIGRLLLSAVQFMGSLCGKYTELHDDARPQETQFFGGDLYLKAFQSKFNGLVSYFNS